jgi:hypothetical protein
MQTLPSDHQVPRKTGSSTGAASLSYIREHCLGRHEASVKRSSLSCPVLFLQFEESKPPKKSILKYDYKYCSIRSLFHLGTEEHLQYRMSYSATYLDTQTQTYHKATTGLQTSEVSCSSIFRSQQKSPAPNSGHPSANSTFVYDLDHHNYNFKPVSSSPPVAFEQVVRV